MENSSMRFVPAAFVLSTALVAACSSGGNSDTTATDAALAGASSAAAQTVVAIAPLAAADGAARGEARLVAIGDRVELRVAGTGLPVGNLGMHLHTVGSCDAPKFESAGPHLNPGNRKHGSENPDGSHLGDLPNLTVAADGTGNAVAGLAEMRSGAEQALFDTDGTAIVIHAKADDYKTDPSGDSGDRIACGVMTRAG